MIEAVRRLSLLVSTSAAVGVLALALAPGCRDATEVTVEISLAKRATCKETSGTAITVGTDPVSTQQRVADQFVTATTTSCTESTRQIGTLVVTPGGGKGSVIVVVAYDKSVAPSSCTPPRFTGCIVARRQFTFSDHHGLHLPITIDPDCKDVPCDAFSTCRTGKCFSSEVSCTGDTCPEPGALEDGGTNDDAAVILDGSQLDGQTTNTDGGVADGATDAPADAPMDGSTGSDGATLDGGSSGAYCSVDGDLLCPNPTVCNTGSSCCVPSGGGATVCDPGAAKCQAAAKQYCCANAPCPGGVGACPVAVRAFGGGGGIPILPLPGGATPAGVCP